MKNIVALMLVVVSLIVSGCGNSRYVEGVEYDTYGLFNESSMKNDNIEYRIIKGNVIWSVILCQSIIFPIYFIGFSLYEPVGPKGAIVKGSVK